jgi:hypothetical protein
MTEPKLADVERALSSAAHHLDPRGKRFALVGGLAVSIRAEVRFTRDVDLAVTVLDDEEAEGLVFDLKKAGYHAVATVEHEARGRLSTSRLLSPHGITVDLLFASSGIEKEIVTRSSVVELPRIGRLPVARPEELLAMKILSMTQRRLKDVIDARSLIEYNPELDVDAVRANLRLIRERGYHRGEDLDAKLAGLLSS